MLSMAYRRGCRGKKDGKGRAGAGRGANADDAAVPLDRAADDASVPARNRRPWW